MREPTTSTACPLVSVILPVYNSMPYLTETMESVLKQDLGNIEIIAVNDGSTDGSGDELDRFAALDERISVHHQANSGWPGMPRNRGLEVARGTFVLFMDADDTLAPNALSSLVNMAEERDADVVIPRFKGTGGRGVQALFAVHPEGGITVSRAMETLSPQKLFRREMIERDQLRFPEGKVRLEDGIFVTRAYTLARDIAFCGSGPLYFIAARDDGQNISARPIDPDNYVSSCRKIAELLREGVTDPQEAETLVREFFSRKGLRFYAAKRWLRFNEERRQHWVSLHKQFLEDFVSVESDEQTAHPTDRRKLSLIREGDIDGLTRLISAEEDLVHASSYLQGKGSDHGVELIVAIAPEGATPAPTKSKAQQGVLSRGTRFAHRTLRLVLRKSPPGPKHRPAGSALGNVTGAYLILAGRKVRNTLAVQGELRGADAGSLHVSFTITNQELSRFQGERVDLWTIAETAPDLSGRQARLHSLPLSPKNKIGGLVYATNRGNLSLDLRKWRG